MSRFIYIFFLFGLIIIGLENSTQAQGVSGHLFRNIEPRNIEAYVLVSDDRKDTSATVDFREEVESHLKKSLEGVNFIFVNQMSEMKHFGNIICIIISVRKSELTFQDPYQIAITSYKVSIYDFTKAPIFLRDGTVSFDERIKPESDILSVIYKTVDVTNKRLVAFLKRNITHKSFHRKED